MKQTWPQRPRPIRVSEFERIIDAGIFDDDDRGTELLAGEVSTLSRPGVRHASCVNRLNRLFTDQYGARCIVQVQNPVEVDGHTLALPDVVVSQPVRVRDVLP